MPHEYELLDKGGSSSRDQFDSELDHDPPRNKRLDKIRLTGIVVLGLLLWAISLYLVAVYAKNVTALTTAKEGEDTNLIQIPVFIPPLPIITPPIWSDNILEIDFNIEGSTLAHNFTALTELCSKTKWNSNRYISCDSMQGGIANIYNALLNCIRYSIEAGAGLKLPTLYLRGALEDPAVNLHTGGRAGIEHFFDLEHFKVTLGNHCPQLRLFEDFRDIVGFESAVFTAPFRPRDVYTLATGLPGNPFHEFNSHTKTFREDFDKLYPESEEASGTKIYRFAFALFDWDITSQDSPGFWMTFGRILKFRKDTRLLASEVYHKLLQVKDFSSSTTSTSSNTGSARSRGQYFGAHLRSEKDSPESWTNPNHQMNQYISLTLSHSLSTIYVASGDALEVEKFRTLASNSSLSVFGKEDVLSQASKQYLQTSLSFDQGALIDYLVLLKSFKFAGIGMSSFSQSIASRRHLMGNQREELMTHEGDEFSLLVEGAVAPTFRVTTYP